jgi:hypothetical protein
MPSISAQSAPQVDDFGVAVERYGDVEGQTVSFLTIHEDSDLAPLFAAADLPDGRCQCPHHGYVFAGTLTFTFADRVETAQAGEAVAVAPGHTPAATAGSEFVMFSPAKEYAELNAAVSAAMAKMQANQPS